MTFTDRVCMCILEIPMGRVCTYGGVAAAAGSPRAARQVVRILHTQSQKRGLPWHRVVNKTGEVALSGLGACEQRSLLEGEGVIFDKNQRIDLEKFGYFFNEFEAMILIEPEKRRVDEEE